MNAVWEEQWLSLSCQWELFIWMCVWYLWSVISFSIILFLFHLSIFWIFWRFQTFFLKSSDLSMVNPHISLNPWNPLIHGAILRFSEDFYCEIHGFHWQSSDLVGGFISVKSSGRSEEFIYFVWVSVWWLEPWLPFTQSLSDLSHCHLQVVFNWELDLSWTQIWLRSQICLCRIISFDLYSIHLNLIMKSSTVLGWNPWIS